MRILIISPEDWGECWISKHHYAEALGRRGHQVFFMGPSVDVAKSSQEVALNVRLIPSPLFPRGFRMYPGFLRRRFLGAVKRRLAVDEGLFDLVWSFDGSRFLELAEMAPRSIFHMVDFIDSIPWQIPARDATVCLGCSYHISRALRTENENSHFLRHGCVAPPEVFPKQGYLLSNGRPNAVFAGNLANKHVDREKLQALLLGYPGVNFHFFGTTGSGNLGGGSGAEYFLAQILALENTYFHGSVTPDALSAIYAQADVLLVCNLSNFHKLGSPHKIMEYLVSGTPVLMTFFPEYEEIADFVVMEDDIQAYCNGLQRALETGGEKSEQRKSFALAHLYDKQLDRVSSLLESGL